MNRTRARETLLQQHERLRGLLARTAELALQLPDDASVADALAELLPLVRTAFEEHNRYEESVLRPMLTAADPLGPARVDRMMEEHDQEHRSFVTFLGGEVAHVAANLADFVEEVEAHMAAEERVFLNVAVLSDPIA